MKTRPFELRIFYKYIKQIDFAFLNYYLSDLSSFKHMFSISSIESSLYCETIFDHIGDFLYQNY